MVTGYEAQEVGDPSGGGNPLTQRFWNIPVWVLAVAGGLVLFVILRLLMKRRDDSYVATVGNPNPSSGGTRDDTDTTPTSDITSGLSGISDLLEKQQDTLNDYFTSQRDFAQTQQEDYLGQLRESDQRTNAGIGNLLARISDANAGITNSRDLLIGIDKRLRNLETAEAAREQRTVAYREREMTLLRGVYNGLGLKNPNSAQPVAA